MERLYERGTGTLIGGGDGQCAQAETDEDIRNSFVHVNHLKGEHDES